MDFPDEYIKDILDFSSISDLIENLYLKSLIDAYPKVLKIDNIQNLDENHIRDEFQKILCFSSGKLSDLLNSQFVFLGIENQIIKKDNKRKRTDIEFFIPKLKYVIECKKLKSVNKTQYINNGIYRFINHKYIGEFDKYAGMCSFIVNGNIEYIIKETKKRVEKYQNNNIDNKTLCNYDYSFSSTHTKIDKKELLIHHLFFDMNDKTIPK